MSIKNRWVVGVYLACTAGWLGVPPATAGPPVVGSKAPEFRLNTIDGHSLSLKESNVDGPVILVVLRGWPGYQCPVCTQQVGDLIGKAQTFAEMKAKVLLIYPGPADELKMHAEEFRGSNQAMPESFELLIDPDYVFTNLYGLRWNESGETAFPSTFVIDQTGNVCFAKVSKTHGDRASSKEVIKVLNKLVR
jgi:thioredoxin-dependent peroxiredoxin